MVLPFELLRTAKNQPMMVELKNGETYSGVLVGCDARMNLQMRDSVCTSRDGSRFWRLTECFIRGNTLKYMRLPDEVVELAKLAPAEKKAAGGKGEGQRPRKAAGRGRGQVKGEAAGPRAKAARTA
jgi:U6 snRNA-associated Sm-like protein LSm4